MAGILTHEQNQLALRLHARGWPLVDIAREIGCSAPMVRLMVREGEFASGVANEWEPRAGCLRIEERERILVGMRAGDALTVIARRLGRAPSAISREVVANGGREGYSAQHAQQRARKRAGCPKPYRLAPGRLRDEVAGRLQQLWSPDEIARQLPLDFLEDIKMRVSHLTINQLLYVQGRGELRRELARCLRSCRTRRRKRGTLELRGRLPGIVVLADRPAEADDRAVPGH